MSPLLANLFLHYALDVWLRREMKSVRFCRYADDGVIHCKSEEQAKLVLRKLGLRLRECGLELHPDKTRIVYCHDVNRQGAYRKCSTRCFAAGRTTTGRFYASALKPLWRSVNDYLVRWLQRKYKRLHRRVMRAVRELGRLAAAEPTSFVHWEKGMYPRAIR